MPLHAQMFAIELSKKLLMKSFPGPKMVDKFSQAANVYFGPYFTSWGKSRTVKVRGWRTIQTWAFLEALPKTAMALSLVFASCCPLNNMVYDSKPVCARSIVGMHEGSLKVKEYNSYNVYALGEQGKTN